MWDTEMCLLALPSRNTICVPSTSNVSVNMHSASISIQAPARQTPC